MTRAQATTFIAALFDRVKMASAEKRPEYDVLIDAEQDMISDVEKGRYDALIRGYQGDGRPSDN